MIVLALAPTPATRRGHSAQKPSKRIASSKRVLSRATSRTESEKLFEAGLTAFENEHGKLALQDWRSSAQINPKSPLVHLFISLVTTDQQEQRTERRRAQALAFKATKRERLLIKWLSGVEEGTARAEYEKAFRQAANPSDQIHCAIQSALTYLREKKARRAIAVLDSVASQAHDRRLPLLEAEAFRDMALIERDTQQSLRFLDKASAALAAIPTRSGPELPRERAEVLRIRATSLAGSGNARAAAEALNQLDQLTKTAHDMALDRCYAGAMGSVLVLQQKFDQAIPYLEEDTSNPLSMRDLIVAYTQRRSADRAHVLELKLSALNQPTGEQALVVPDLRARLAATKDKRGWLRRLTGRER